MNEFGIIELFEFCFSIEYMGAPISIQVYKDNGALRPWNGSKCKTWGGWQPRVTNNTNISICAAVMWQGLWSAN